MVNVEANMINDGNCFFSIIDGQMLGKRFSKYNYMLGEEFYKFPINKLVKFRLEETT